MKRVRFLKKYVLVLSCILSVSMIQLGCSGKTISEEDPAALYQEAEEDIKSDHYQLAIDKLRAIKNKHPYSKQAVDAQLRIADVYFMQESFTEAATAYESFRDLHPKHEKVPYAMHRLALAHFNDIPGNIARDQTPAVRALESFQSFVRRFPNAPESADANQKIAEVRKILASKELYIGNFYYKRKKYDSALPRFEKIIALYGDTLPAQEARVKAEEIQKMPAPRQDTGATNK